MDQTTQALVFVIGTFILVDLSLTSPTTSESSWRFLRHYIALHFSSPLLDFAVCVLFILLYISGMIFLPFHLFSITYYVYNYVYYPPNCCCICWADACCCACASFAFCNTTPITCWPSKYFDTHRSVQVISPKLKSGSLCRRLAHFWKHVEAILLNKSVYISISVLAVIWVVVVVVGVVISVQYYESTIREGERENEKLATHRISCSVFVLLI